MKKEISFFFSEFKYSNNIIILIMKNVILYINNRSKVIDGHNSGGIPCVILY